MRRKRATLRPDDNWEKCGFTDDDRIAWLRGGLTNDEAHFAAMWPGWRGKEAVQEGNVREIHSATPDDALKYLTDMIRADRFSEGALLDAFENGLVSSALHRVLGFQSPPNDDDVDRRGYDAMSE